MGDDLDTGGPATPWREPSDSHREMLFPGCEETWMIT